MTVQRKVRVDSIQGQKNLQEAMQTPIVSPLKLTPEQREVFDELIDGLPREKWDKQSIRMAARLSKLEVYMEELIDDVLLEGATCVNARGTLTMNPKQSAMTTLVSSIKMIRGSLGLTASQRGITKSNDGPARKQEKKATAALKAVAGKTLLA